MELNQKSSNFSNLTCFFNNGLSLVTSKDFLVKRLICVTDNSRI